MENCLKSEFLHLLTRIISIKSHLITIKKKQAGAEQCQSQDQLGLNSSNSLSSSIDLANMDEIVVSIALF